MICNLTNKTILSRKTYNALSFRDRLQGMIGRKFTAFDAIVFQRCSAIHTCFMKSAIDVIFLSRTNEVMKLVPACPPWKLAVSCKNASLVIELPDGILAETHTAIGDKLDLNAEVTTEKQQSFICNTISGNSESALCCNEESALQ